MIGTAKLYNGIFAGNLSWQWATRGALCPYEPFGSSAHGGTHCMDGRRF